MASVAHASQPQYHTPSFSRDSTSSSLGALQFSQIGISPFEAQSVTSTPAETPPPSRGHPQQMSFNMGGYGPPNGMHLPQGAPRGLANVNGQMQQQQYPLGHKPEIYTVRQILA